MSTRPSNARNTATTWAQRRRPTVEVFTPSVVPLQQGRSIRILPIGKRKHPQPTRFNNDPRLPILDATPAGAYQRKLAADSLRLRTGVITVKRGMTAVYLDASGAPIGVGDDAAAGGDKPAVGKPMEDGRRVAATVLQMDRVQVVANKTRERHGYFAVVVGEGWRNPDRVGKAMLGVYAKSRIGAMMPGISAERVAGGDRMGEGGEKDGTAVDGFIGLPPKREVREFRVRDKEGLLPIGTFLQPSWFTVGQYVDAKGTARGMGFAGGMKRHGFKGQGASHGVSLTHRSMGSAGGGQGSGSRVHPGKKMPGRMGGQQHTVQNLKVLMVDEANGLVVVNGAVSGRKGDLVTLKDALRKPWPKMENRETS